MWYELSQIGVNLDAGWQQNRHTILCNRVSAILALFTLIVFLGAFVFFGWIIPVRIALISSFTFLIPIAFNKLGWTNASRLLLSILLSLVCVIDSIADKFDVPGQLEELQYFEFRLFLMAAGIFPLILFYLKERTYLIIALLFNLCCLGFYDQLHELFGVGFYQLGFTSPNYYFLNYIVIATFFMLAGSTFFLKKSFEEYEGKNEVLIRSFQEANETIRQQREMLAKENFQLNHELVNKNNQLEQTNQELIRHNNDLMQFSYSVSHNLRAPVASLMGLLRILERPSSPEEFKYTFGHINRSVNALDQIIKDLGSIIDIRSAVGEIKQKIVLEEEINNIRSLLEKQIRDFQVSFSIDFSEAAEILSIRPMISSILYNLISNAIKYRSPDRTPHIVITSAVERGFVKISVRDNGLGMDLNRFKDKLFGLYKRFHTHTEGKGLGLFLVKLQTEALEGNVEVQSQPGLGTTFTVTLKMPELAQDQYLLDNQMLKVIYKPRLDTMVAQWKRSITKEEFREMYRFIAGFMKDYRLINWVIDITKVTNDEQELNEVRKEFYPQLKQLGLKRMALIKPRNSVTQEEFERIQNLLTSVYELEFVFLETMEEAMQWVEDQTVDGQ
jgi:signal transduction histidine kinase